MNENFIIARMATRFVLLGVLAVTCSLALATNTAPLNDFCVAEPKTPVFINGIPCKDPKTVQANDFFGCGLQTAGNTSNPLGSKVTPMSAAIIPGLNTLGISMSRMDFVPGGVNPPHIHPRATEIITVLEGCLQVGFITSNPENKHITKNLSKGDVFVFPMGLVHYQKNVGNTNAVVLAAFNSENPGTMTLTNALLGSHPVIPDNILAKSFQSNKVLVHLLEKKF